MQPGIFSLATLSHPRRREWIALTFVVGLTLLFLPVVLWKVLHYGQGDAQVFFRGGWAIWSGYPLYQVTDHHGWTNHYPPTFALLMAPFANPLPGYPQPAWALPYPVAVAVWYLLNAACLLLAVHVWANALERHRPLAVQAGYLQRGYALRLGPILALLPFLGDSLARGQTVPLLLFVIVLYLCLYVERRVVAAAFFLALATTIKEFPVIFAVFPVLRRDWRFLAWAVGWGLLLLLVVPVVCLGPATTFDLYRVMFTEHLAGIASGAMSTKIASETSPGGFSSIGVGALLGRLAAGHAFYTSPLPPWASAVQLLFNVAVALAIVVLGRGGFWNLRGPQPAAGYPLLVGGAILCGAIPLMIAFAGPAYVPFVVPLVTVVFLEGWRRRGAEMVTAAMIAWSVAAWASMIVLEVPGDWVKLLGPMTWVFLFLLLAGLSVLGAVSASADEKLMGAGAHRLSG